MSDETNAVRVSAVRQPVRNGVTTVEGRLLSIVEGRQPGTVVLLTPEGEEVVLDGVALGYVQLYAMRALFPDRPGVQG